TRSYGDWSSDVCSSDLERLEAVLDGELAVLRVGAVGDDDFDARVAQVLRVGVALAAVAEDGDGLARQRGERAVLVVEGLDGLVRSEERRVGKGVRWWWA